MIFLIIIMGKYLEDVMYDIFDWIDDNAVRVPKFSLA